MNIPKCYTWLESYGSAFYDGKKKKYFQNPLSRQNFANAFAETPNLNLEVHRKSSPEPSKIQIFNKIDPRNS